MDPYVSRRHAIAQATTTAEQLKALQKDASGAMLVVYVAAMRAGGELRITQTEIVNATGGKVRIAHSETGDWIVTAVPDPTEPEFSPEEMRRYQEMVAREEAKAPNGRASPQPVAALEGDDVIGR